MDNLKLPEGLDKETFKQGLPEILLRRYDSAWMLEAPNKKHKVIGVLFGIAAGDFLIVGDALWLPWSTNRNKIETIIGFLDVMRRANLCLFTVKSPWKRYYDYIAAHGVIRQVGTIHHRGEKLSLFQTRMPDVHTV